MNNKTTKINIRNEYGEKLTIEDAVILRNDLLKLIQDNDLTIIDFKDTIDCPNYFSVLLTQFLSNQYKKDIFNKLSFINLDNNDSFKRVYYGTATINIGL